MKKQYVKLFEEFDNNEGHSLNPEKGSPFEETYGSTTEIQLDMSWVRDISIFDELLKLMGTTSEQFTIEYSAGGGMRLFTWKGNDVILGISTNPYTNQAFRSNTDDPIVMDITMEYRGDTYIHIGYPTIIGDFQKMLPIIQYVNDNVAIKGYQM